MKEKQTTKVRTGLLRFLLLAVVVVVMCWRDHSSSGFGYLGGFCDSNQIAQDLTSSFCCECKEKHTEMLSKVMLSGALELLQRVLSSLDFCKL